MKNSTPSMNMKEDFDMKSCTILCRMQSTNTASISQTELLTNALHREQKLATDTAIRFRPLFGDFDLVNADLWKTGEFIYEKCKPIGTLNDLVFMFRTTI